MSPSPSESLVQVVPVRLSTSSPSMILCLQLRPRPGQLLLLAKRNQVKDLRLPTHEASHPETKKEEVKKEAVKKQKAKDNGKKDLVKEPKVKKDVEGKQEKAAKPAKTASKRKSSDAAPGDGDDAPKAEEDQKTKLFGYLFQRLLPLWSQGI